MASTHRARAVLKIKRTKTVSVTGKANAMCSGFAGNTTLFATPNPSIAAIETQTGVVNKTEVVAATRAKGAAAARNVQRSILVGMLETGVTYVQGLADASGTPEQAMSTILAAGLSVALVGQRAKAILTVTQGPEPGTVILNANAKALTSGIKGKFFFNWQSTADGKTFVNLPSTPKAKTTVANLTPLSTYGFRVCITNSAGVAEAWSQVFSFLVH